MAVRYTESGTLWRAIGLVGLVVVMLAAGLGLQSGTALSQTQPLKVGWALPNPPTEARVGLRLVITNLELSNGGTQPWFKAGPNALRLGYRWFGLDNKPLDPKNKDNGYDELKADLPQDIPVNGRVLYPQFLVATPAAPGEYSLHIDLLQGADGWLVGKGSPDFSFKLTVRAKDTAAPTSRVTVLPLYSTSTSFTLSWDGKDEDNGSGLTSYDVQYKLAGEADWRDLLLSTPATSTVFSGDNGKLYLFRSRATDRAGNGGKYPDAEQASTRIDSLPPSARVETLPVASPETFLVRWSSFDNVAGGATALCDVQYREGTNGSWTDWQSGTSVGSALFRGSAGKSYSFRARATDYAGNQGEYSAEAQATTAVSPALNTLFGLPTSQVAATAPLSPTVGAGPQSLFFPLAVKAGDNGTGTTSLTVYNPGPAPLDVFVRFNDRSGAPISTTVNNALQPVSNDAAVGLARVDTVLRTVGPGETTQVWAGALGPGSYNGWAELRAAGPFEASAVRQPANGRPVQYAPTGAASTLYLPYVRKADPLSSSQINLANTGPTPADVTITYYDAGSGQPLATDKRTLPRYGSTRFSVGGAGTADPNLRFSGTAIISSSAPLAANVETLLDDGSPSSYPALTMGATVAPQLPVYREVDGLTTTLVVQNTGKEALPVKLEFLNSNGEVVAMREQTVPGFGRLLEWQGDLRELQPGFVGKVRVSTTTTGGALVVTVLGGGPGSGKKSQF